MTQSQRHQRILEILSAEGESPVVRLAAEFGVSAMTIRRDLDALAADGKVIRTHGGAAPAGRIVFDFQFLQRAQQHDGAKRAIAATAAALVRDGQSVLLDSGTTTLAVARALEVRKHLTVITTSLPIASALQYNEQIEVELLGGVLRREAPDLIGALTDANLDLLRADMAFIGADAVDEQGRVYNRSLAVARLLTRMAAAARKVFIVADSSKVGRTALARFGRVAQWDGLITDGGLSPVLARALQRAGVRVLTSKRGRR